MPHHDRVGMIETIFGKFTFIADNYEYSILSPAFERPDIELFILQIRQSLEQGNKVLFLDIGANVGLYTIGLTNRIGKKRFTTYAFEPDPVYHTLLLNNITANDIKDVVVYNVAVGNGHRIIETDGFRLVKDKVEKTRVRFRIRTLDSIITPSVLRRFDQIFVKIDIEGHEESAMDGAKNIWKSGKKIRLMIEDCVNPSIIDYLHAHDFRFIKKITPYDSFWELH
jgi:FkbM family methyltransferase